MQPFLSLVLPGKPRYNKGSARPVHGGFIMEGLAESSLLRAKCEVNQDDK